MDKIIKGKEHAKMFKKGQKPKSVFRAKVILECPKSKINNLINFPPVFRNFEIKDDV